jgi:hypothetical protein
MARFNEILVGRYNRFLQKLLTLKGGPPAPQLSSEVGVTFNLFNGVENRYLEGWNRFAWSFLAGPTAAQTNGLRLRNPSGSNVVAVIEKITVWASGSATVPLVSIGDNNPDLETSASPAPAPLDNRQGTLANHTSTLIASTGALSPASQRIIWQGSNTTVANVSDVIWDENQEIPILPQRSITVQQIQVNTQLSAAFFWRERFLEESERT